MLDPVRYNAIYFISVKLKVTIAGDQFYFLRHVSYLLEDWDELLSVFFFIDFFEVTETE